eukprot:960027-Pyramimonas_sp.AAC.1
MSPSHPPLPALPPSLRRPAPDVPPPRPSPSIPSTPPSSVAPFPPSHPCPTSSLLLTPSPADAFPPPAPGLLVSTHSRTTLPAPWPSSFPSPFPFPLRASRATLAAIP